ncbi:DnaJ domain-containing protein [Cladochytrium replicatum]|nr:DnaJ domain-containing protein [Cladochytrium replicatum]
MRTCYYDLLGVARTATSDELKKAYRRKALELHPDKNIERIEEATRLFAEVQQAYEILSDDQERAWYDSHREAILRDEESESDSDSGKPGAGRPRRPHTSSLRTDQLMKYFSTSCFRGIVENDTSSFFGVYSAIFERILSEELDAMTNDNEAGAAELPDISFIPINSWSTEVSDNAIRQFYSFFGGFASIKSFRWYDEYRLSDAPDRRVRRLLEKHNLKARETAKREFSETVRRLSQYVKKRDPRWKAVMDRANKEKEQKEAERRKQLEREKLDRSRAKAELAKQHLKQNWERGDEQYDMIVDDVTGEVTFVHRGLTDSEEEEEEGDVVGDDEIVDDEIEEDEDLEDLVEDLYCVACDKEFKSLQQRENHDRSKKHLKKVEMLRSQMIDEENAIDDDVAEAESTNSHHSEDRQTLDINEDSSKKKKSTHISSDEQESYNVPAMAMKKKKKTKKRQQKASNGFGLGVEEIPGMPAQESDKDSDSLNNTRRSGKRRNAKVGRDVSPATTSTNVAATTKAAVSSAEKASQDVSDLASFTEHLTINDDAEPPFLGAGRKSTKGGEKSTAKSSSPSASGETEQLICNVCQEKCASRNKLFDHIKRTKHALAVPGSEPASKKRGRKSRLY